MSESDSDADFESADEDTEQDFSDKCSKDLFVKDEKHNTNVCNNVVESVSDVPNKVNKLTGSLGNYNPEERKVTHQPLNEAKEHVQEKKRVALRLEKKLRQKNLELKENTAEAENFKPTIDLKSNSERESSWGFGLWGTSILSTAASSVSTLTSQVSQGIGTMFETVESSLGAPPPEELANILKSKNSGFELPAASKTEENSKLDCPNLDEQDKKNTSSSILTEMSSWTKTLETTGTKVIMGGLDTLELIGKKTIDILTEGDPGFRQKRAVFSHDTTLSQLLREAKLKADERNENEEFDSEIHYSQCFDESQGLVHLEALEMLSRQCEVKVQDMLRRLPCNSELKEKFKEIKNICEGIPPMDDTPDDEKQHHFEVVFMGHSQALNLPIKVEKILQVQKQMNDWLDDCLEEGGKPTKTPEEIYQEAIRSLANFTAKSVEHFHKIAELILVQPKLEPSSIHCATHLTGLTIVLCVEVCIVSSRYCSYLSAVADNSDDPDSVTPMITSVYLEASNSNSYIQEAYQLLIPVLQQSLFEPMSI